MVAHLVSIVCQTSITVQRKVILSNLLQLKLETTYEKLVACAILIVFNRYELVFCYS